MAESSLVLGAYLDSGDDRFLPTLRETHDPRVLAPIADRWKRDHRPWARQQIFAYLELPMNAIGHETVVKRLFKWAEERNDDELMAAFAVAFDRLVRRVRRKQHHYDWQTRTSWQTERLYSPWNTLPHVGPQPEAERLKRKDRRRRAIDVKQAHYWRDGRRVLFTYHTRYYLRRRAWRYFRRKGFQKPKEYCAAVALMLRRYTDDMIKSGENLLDAWSLMHACFRHSDVLDIGPSKINVKANRSLAEMQAAPEFPELWRAKEATRVLVSLLSGAQSRAVRVWAMQLLRRDHADHFADFTADEILPLLDHADEEVQAFAAEMLEKSTALARIDLATWLKLLQTRNLAALEIIARLMEQHVTADRLTLEQMVDLANAAPVPVARLGFRFLQTHRIESAAERATIARLAQARSAGVAGEITAWALSILGAPAHYDVDAVSRFFDSLLQPARAAAWAWLTPQSPGYDDAALWSRLIETPYEDVRFHVVADLQRRANLPGAALEQVTFVWTTVLLNIHRGGRSKLAALKQISRAIVADPARAEPLLPVLAVAIRSVRMPEVRTGLAAVVAAVEMHPPLADAVARHLPEMQLAQEAAV
jgi:hypothetical protein